MFGQDYNIALMVEAPGNAEYIGAIAPAKRVPSARAVSRKGDCWDNAAMESFFASLKKEHVYTKPRYLSRDVARADLFEYIEGFYNRRRLHSTLGYMSPVQYEESRKLPQVSAH